jgi:G-protein signaling modulator 2
VKEDLLEMIAGIQGKRLDEQRACLPGLNPSKENEFIMKRLSVASSTGGSTKSFPDDGFFDQLMRCQVSA